MSTILSLVLLLPGLVVFLFWLLAERSGWKALSLRFAINNRPKGFRCRGQSLTMGRVNFQSSLIIITCPEGLYLRPIFPFRLFHPALLIPWDQLNNRRDIPGIFRVRIAVDVGTPPVTRIVLFRSLFAEIILDRPAAGHIAEPHFPHEDDFEPSENELEPSEEDFNAKS
jgi:hypothetical protein